MKCNISKCVWIVIFRSNDFYLYEKGSEDEILRVNEFVHAPAFPHKSSSEKKATGRARSEKVSIFDFQIKCSSVVTRSTQQRRAKELASVH